MLEPIKVKPNDRRDRMEPASRVNFGKTYTVEHNVKVYDFGNVDKDSAHRLRSQWKRVWNEDFEEGSRDEESIAEEQNEDESVSDDEEDCYDDDQVQ